jgi:hypothetical protein
MKPWFLKHPSLAMAVLAGGYVSAHHSFAAEFDAEKPARLVGVITKIEWSNPHSYQRSPRRLHLAARPGTYSQIEREWNHVDFSGLHLDMRCRLISSPHGLRAASDRFQALL